MLLAFLETTFLKFIRNHSLKRSCALNREP
jgi:hypothetical protein